MVEPLALELTLTTMLKPAGDPWARLAVEQVIVPVAPGVRVLQVHPPGGVIEENVVPVGTGSVSVAFAAAFGPLLVTVTEYVMLFPTKTGSGESDLVTARSALRGVMVTFF